MIVWILAILSSAWGCGLKDLCRTDGIENIKNINKMIVWILAILSSAWGCGLKDLCRTDGIESIIVDPFSDFQVSATCSGPDASSSSWYIRRYMNGNDSLDGLGAPLTLNDSFRQNGNELTIHEINGFAEGTYHCGVDNDTIQPASLCLFVQGRPFFKSCPGEFEACPRIMQIAGTPNGNVSIDTRISFTRGGFCMTKRIRHLKITKLYEENEEQDSELYFCSNLRNFSRQLCKSNEKFRVEQQQTCIEPDITSCKYDMKLVLLNFSISDEGMYNVTVEFDNPNLGRGILRQQFNLSSSNGNTTTGTLARIVVPTVIGIVIVLVIILIVIIIIIIVRIRKKMKDTAEEIPLQTASAPPSSPPDKERETDLPDNNPPPDRERETAELPNDDSNSATVVRPIKVKCPDMLVVTDDKIVIVGDSDEEVNIYSKEGDFINSFKLKGKSRPTPRGVATDGEFLFISDKSNRSVAKYDFDGTFIKSVGKKGTKQLEFNGRCGISTNITMGRIYIADECNNRIQVLDLDLNFLFKFGSRGNHKKEFDHPRDVAVANNGTVYVADMNNNRVQVFNAEGEYIREFGNDLDTPTGLCIDNDGHVFVADHANFRVCIFNPRGELTDSFGKNEKKKIDFTDHYGIAVDSNGKIYTADYGNDCVQIFSR